MEDVFTTPKAGIRRTTLDSPAAYLQKRRNLVYNSLPNVSLNGLPSRYLRPAENTSDLSISSEPADSSTPRESLVERPASVGAQMARLSHAISNTDISIDEFMEQYNRTIGSESELDFSLRQNSLPFASMNSFNCNGLPNTTSHDDLLQCTSTTTENSFQMSDILKILKEEDNSPSKAIEMLLKGNKMSCSSDKDSVIKENDMNEANPSTSGATSTRSCSTMSNLPDGKLPIETTRTELIWGQVKVGRSAVQDFVIRNKCDFRIRMQLSVTNPAFKLLQLGSEVECVPSMSLLLHPHEPKRIRVSFSASKIGAVVDRLYFKSLDLTQTKNQSIALYAYGGHTAVQIVHVPQTASGIRMLSLGDMRDATKQQPREIVLHNMGSIPAFALMVFHRADIHFTAQIVKAEPSCIIIPPKKQAAIKLTWNANKQEKLWILKSRKNVIELGTFKLHTGSEILRWRMRRLCRKAEGTSSSIDSLISALSVNFEGECAPQDHHMFKESLEASIDLLQQVTTTEIVVTIEQEDIDVTLVGQQIAELGIGSDGDDESGLFRGFDQTSVSVLDQTVIERFMLRAQPEMVVLTPPIKQQDIVVVSFEARDASPDMRMGYKLEVIPKGAGLTVSVRKSGKTIVGQLRNGETILLDVQCINDSISKPKDFVILLMLDNGNELEIRVKVIYLQL